MTIFGKSMNSHFIFKFRGERFEGRNIKLLILILQ